MPRALLIALALALGVTACGAAAEGEVAEPTTVPTTTRATTTTTTTTTAPLPAGDVKLGVSSPFDGQRRLEARVTELEREVIGDTFGAVRIYKRWDEPFPSPSEQFLASELRATTIVLSVSTQRLDGSWVPWSEIAVAEPDSTIGRRITQWGEWLAQWDGPPLTVTLDHEPDFYRNGNHRGQPADYVAAYRRFFEEVRQVAPSIQTTWISVAFFFRGDEGANHGPDFYPGDDVVDFLAVDGFNWASCRDEIGEWRSFNEIFADFREWATLLHPDKPVIVAEVGSVEDPTDPERKARWLLDAASTLENWVQVEMVIFWDNVHEDADACDFRLDSSPQAARAFSAMAGRSIFRRSWP